MFELPPRQVQIHGHDIWLLSPPSGVYIRAEEMPALQKIAYIVAHSVCDEDGNRLFLDANDAADSVPLPVQSAIVQAVTTHLEYDTTNPLPV